MAASTSSRRSAGMWIALAAIAISGVTLGIVFVSGLGMAEETGRPLSVPAVSVTPGPSATPVPGPTPTPSESADDSPEVVDAPPPVIVELDDHGGNNGNSGSGGSGSSGGSDDSGGSGSSGD